MQRGLVGSEMCIRDRDKDGKIMKSDIMEFMKHPSFPPKAADEFVKYVFKTKDFITPDSDPIPMAIFGSFLYADKDRDNYISKSELVEYMKEFYLITGEEMPTDEVINERFEKSQKDGLLNFDKFTRIFDLKESLLSGLQQPQQDGFSPSPEQKLSLIHI
eukprot:TRINITY_DN3570_c0_g2_i1.p2 TRINITY_DN3570_c0_g2~~TRINITY_DN3570_c0_g2_i1.p2  ORF type:complete len:160 (-),score=29.92 TRINITY_DN3570_c0_g2_i1:144-623(-)